MQHWAPEMYEKYANMMKKLQEHCDGLTFNFDGSIFPSATMNLGPCVSLLPHYDVMNLAFGWCMITSIGTFDPDHGGHSMLKEARLIIRFPPGSTIGIPSAIIEHCNIPVPDDEVRGSFVQFASANLFRWIENGFCTDAEAKAEAKKTRRDNAKTAERRKEEGLALFKSDGCREFQSSQSPIGASASATISEFHQYHLRAVIRSN